MELIPIIYVMDRRISLEKNGAPISFQDFSDMAEGEKKIYILDLDGIGKDKPNLCTYQRVASFHEILVDFGPRNLGDVVDAVMSGANIITLRKNLCPQLNISEIKEITEDEIYVNIERDAYASLDGAEGIINFNSRDEIEKDYNYREFLKKTGLKNKIYSYESEPKNISYWTYFNVGGLLVDLNKIKEFKNAV